LGLKIGPSRFIDIGVQDLSWLSQYKSTEIDNDPFFRNAPIMKAAAINRAMHQGSLVAQVALLRRI